MRNYPKFITNSILVTGNQNSSHQNMGPDIRTAPPLQMLYCVLYGILSLIGIGLLLTSSNYLFCDACINSNLSPARNTTTHQKNNHNDQDKNSKQNDMNPFIKTATFIGLIGYFSALLVVFSITVIEVVYDPILTERDYEQDLAIPAVIFYLLGRWTMLLFFIQRIDYTFRDSIFAYSKCCVNILYGTITFLFISLCLYVILGFSDIIIQDKEIKDPISFYGILIWVTIEFVFSNILMIAFLKKLFHLFVKTMKYTNSAAGTVEIEISMSDTSASPGRKPTLASISDFSNTARNAREQTKESVDPLTLRAMTRYSLLVTVALFSSTVSIFAALFSGWAYWMFMILGADAFINGVCIFLFNKFAEGLYQKLCSYPDKFCKWICVCCISCVYLCKN